MNKRREHASNALYRQRGVGKERVGNVRVNYRLHMDGLSLADKLRDTKHLPDYSVLKYLTQILEGVSFLHRNKIYHSDIKPANILFTIEAMFG